MFCVNESHRERRVPRRATRSLLGVAIGLFTLHLHAQPLSSMHAPGDMTLFGNPDCSHWLRVDPVVKQGWLNAILSPINMGFVRRERPLQDKFAALTSLAPGVKFVDTYCTSRPDTKAMSGAMSYFEELTAAKQ
jgi:hypothetical protein